MRQRRAGSELTGDDEGNVKASGIVRLQKRHRRPGGVMMLAFQVDEEGGFDDYRPAHLSSGAWSAARVASMRLSSSAEKCPPLRWRVSRSPAVMVSSAHRARRTTSLNDSLG